VLFGFIGDYMSGETSRINGKKGGRPSFETRKEIAEEIMRLVIVKNTAASQISRLRKRLKALDKT
jgi:hypothetical protein